MDPIENDTHILKIEDVEMKLPDYGKRKAKLAKLAGESLTFPVKGRYALYDKATGKEVGRTSKKTLIQLPWLNDDGTFIRNGNGVVDTTQNTTWAALFN